MRKRAQKNSRRIFLSGSRNVWVKTTVSQPSSNAPMALRTASELNAEGAAAAAGALDVRVIEFKARTFDGLDVIDLHAVEIHLAPLVDQNIQPVKFVDAVGVLV